MCPGDQLWGIPASKFLTSCGKLLWLWFERGSTAGGGTRGQVRSRTAIINAHSNDSLLGALAVGGTVKSCNVSDLSNHSTTIFSHHRGVIPAGNHLLVMLALKIFQCCLSLSFSICIIQYYTSTEHCASLVKSMIVWNIGNCSTFSPLRRKICLM